MRKIVIASLLVSVLIMSYNNVNKEQCAVVRKFISVGIDGRGTDYHLLLKFADGTVKDELVSRYTYNTTKEFDLYRASK